MSRSDDPVDPTAEGSIADTGMFRRFVEHEQEMEQTEQRPDSFRKYLVALAIIVLIAVGVMVWTLTR